MKKLLAMMFGLLIVVVAVRSFPTGNRHLFPPKSEWYIVELETPGGPLPFELTILDTEQPRVAVVGNGALVASATDSGSTETKGLSFRRDPNGMTIEFSHFDSELRLNRSQDRGVLNGTWMKQRGSSTAQLAAVAHYLRQDRFAPIANSRSNSSSFAGRWSVNFSSSDELAIGVFQVDDDQLATGTFLTTTGDYRYLAGRVDGDLMRLSTFDGAHAFLFHARMQDDGTIAGDFWSGNWWHETWTAERNPDAQLPDMFEQTTVADAAALDDLVFKALDGSPTKVADLLDATDAPARVLYIFGSWCPNCADSCAELKRLKDIYRDDLGVVGLAFEVTDDHERSATQVQRYLDRHGAEWPILIAGLSDKSKASAELPILDKVRSYPTTIFLNSDNEIVSVHTGFTGPATGEVFSGQQREYERLIDDLIGN